MPANGRWVLIQRLKS